MALKHALYVLQDERFRELPPTARHLLTVLAIRASDNGNVCWPGEDELMRSTGMSRATLYRAKGPLRDLIEIDPPGYKRSNCYYFPPVDVKGRRLTEVGKVLAAKRAQEEEARKADAKRVDNSSTDGAKLSTCQQESQIETPTSAFSGLKMRRLPSQIETGGGLNMRPEYKYETFKKSGGLLPSQIETSQNETLVDNYDGSRAPSRAEHYDWIRRHCRAAGLDKQNTDQFLAKHRPWGWNAMKPGVNVCDLIADYATSWKCRNPDEFRYIQECMKNGVL